MPRLRICRPRSPCSGCGLRGAPGCESLLPRTGPPLHSYVWCYQTGRSKAILTSYGRKWRAATIACLIATSLLAATACCSRLTRPHIAGIVCFPFALLLQRIGPLRAALDQGGPPQVGRGQAHRQRGQAADRRAYLPHGHPGDHAAEPGEPADPLRAAVLRERAHYHPAGRPCARAGPH